MESVICSWFKMFKAGNKSLLMRWSCVRIACDPQLKAIQISQLESFINWFQTAWKIASFGKKTATKFAKRL